MKYVLLNNNRFSGAIISHVEKLMSIKELILSNNELTGSLPREVGKLLNITKLSVSHNRLKGLVPTDLSNLVNLKLLHLHSNKLVGSLDLFNYTICSFASDCGSTESSNSLIECSFCSQCCNVDGDCLNTIDDWLSNMIKYNLSIDMVIFLSSAAASISFYMLCLLLMALKVNLIQLPYNVRIKFQQSSVNRFYLSSSLLGWIIALIILSFQVMMCVMFIKSGDMTYSGNLLIYSVSCPDDSLECIDLSEKTLSGWMLCYIILAVNLLHDLLDSLLLIYESIIMRRKKEIAAGIILSYQVALLIVATCIYLQASSASDIMIVKDTVVILFLNNFDQCGFMILERIAPTWLDRLENEIVNKYATSNKNRLATKKKIISTLIHDLKGKIERLEDLREELHNEQKKTYNVQTLKPENQNVNTFNEADYRNMLKELAHRCSELKTKSSFVEKKLFVHSLKSETQNEPCDKDHFENLLNGLVDRYSKLKINLCEGKKQRKITEYYST